MIPSDKRNAKSIPNPMSMRRNPLDIVPVTSIVAVTQTAIGCGIGLLLAGKLRRGSQKTAGWAMLALGVASVLPITVGYLARTINRPESVRGMRRRLESIRQNGGLSENADIF
jgi:hypothetical protein